MGNYLKAKKRLKRFYRRKKLALPQDVDAVMRSVQKAVNKRGHKVYRKDRQRVDRFLAKLFDKHKLSGTTSERFWYLTAVCALIGPTKDYLKGLQSIVPDSTVSVKQKVSKKTYHNSRRKSSKKFSTRR